MAVAISFLLFNILEYRSGSFLWKDLMNHAHIVLYLFKVVNYFDITRVPDIRFCDSHGLCFFLSVDFNLFINFFISIFNFYIVL